VAYYLGIDGGGSKTTCAIGDESAIVANVTGGPSNITRVGEDRARESLRGTILEACGAAGIDLQQVKRTCMGAAGAGRQEIAQAIRRILGEIVGGEVEVVGDMEIALHAAFGDGPGIIVIAGTGSIAYGRDDNGRTARAGGWGFGISDEGSAHWIGREAVRRVLREIDEHMDDSAGTVAQQMPLFREIQAVWNLKSLDELWRTANEGPSFAELFPAVVRAEENGNKLAEQILYEAASELARLAEIVVQRLFRNQWSTKTAISVAGGVFQHSEQIRQIFEKEVSKRNRRLPMKGHVVEPVNGALQMARKGSGPE
jgi:glucosamine kinase